MTDAMRVEMWAAPDAFIGQVMEVRGQEINDGAIRHPAFIRIRDDKRPEECAL